VFVFAPATSGRWTPSASRRATGTIKIIGSPCLQQVCKTWCPALVFHRPPLSTNTGGCAGALLLTDLSLAYARDVARAPVDFVYADLEHNPLDFPALNIFLLGMTDKAAILKKGNLQPNVALFARFPPEADQSQ
jgi:hypothetical protein